MKRYTYAVASPTGVNVGWKIKLCESGLIDRTLSHADVDALLTAMGDDGWSMCGVGVSCIYFQREL